jgi:hypothetical protein
MSANNLKFIEGQLKDTTDPKQKVRISRRYY